MHHSILRSIIGIVIGGALLIGSASPILADAGVSITLTTTVTGGGGFNSGTPSRTPTWQELFPSMNQRGSSAQVDNRPVAQNPPIYIPPVIPQSTANSEFPAHGSQIEVDPNKEPFKIDWFLLVCLGLILISGTIVVILLVRSRRKY